VTIRGEALARVSNKFFGTVWIGGGWLSSRTIMAWCRAFIADCPPG
jgi:hypothetical protein